MNKIYIKSILVALLLATSFVSRSQIINTFAGNGFTHGLRDSGGFSGDGGPANAAELFNPTGVAVDSPGTIYIADVNNQRLRIVNTSGTIQTFAGNGYAYAGSGGFSGDGGPATAAELNQPQAVAISASGNVYIADWGNNRIRMVNTSGVISTFAGTGIPAYNGDGIQATDANIFVPDDIALDAKGNIYFSDAGNNRIRMVNTSGIISTFAGTGVGGPFVDGVQATAANINPSGVSLDYFGNVYITELGGSCVRKVNSTGIINTIAGVGIPGYFGDGGPATDAELKYPSRVTVDVHGNVYIADGANQRIRIVNTSGIINSLAGDGYTYGGYSGDGGAATATELNYPIGVALDASGNLYIGDEQNNRIRRVTGISLGIKNIPSSSNEINIYPSPTTGIFTITGLLKGQIIELYNYTGQKLSAAISDKNTIQFDISNYANGIYLVRILNKDGSVFTTKKVVKME